MKEQFHYWLTTEYDFGRDKKPLQISSADVYVNGIVAISKTLKITTQELYNKTPTQLEKLKKTVFDNENKDRRSHYEALIKFKNKQDLIEDLKAKEFPQRQSDSGKRKEVEEMAIKVVTDYYEKKGYKVITKENDNLGWDLEATKNNIKYLIEVKGLSGKTITVELSPNEYEKSNMYDDYRIGIVTNCLELPILHILKYSKNEKVWKDRFNNNFGIKERISAIISLKK